MTKVLCAISGGVDSAVAALLLKRSGYDVIGAFMRNWDLRDETGHCSTEEDSNYAKKVCSRLKIPFHEVNFVKEYWTNVFQETLDEYERGNTPNPDVLCNKYIKFDAFFKYAKENLNVHNIATGHYAQTSENLSATITDTTRVHTTKKDCFFLKLGGRNNGFLYKAVDQNKDQTFFLNRIPCHVIKHTLFPVGGLLKSSVKTIASSNDLEFVSRRKESMGICFIGLRDFESFITGYIPPRKGNLICLETAENLGEHDGYFKCTIGQRLRLHVKGTTLFIVGKDIKSGDVYVAPGNSHHALFSKAIVTEKPHWIKEVPEMFAMKGRLECDLRVMHREPLTECEIYSLSNEQCLMILNRPLRAITPGQSAVIYSGSKCLGGTKICNIGPSFYESYDGYPNLNPYRSDAEMWTNIWEEFGDRILPRGPSTADQIINYTKMIRDYQETMRC